MRFQHVCIEALCCTLPEEVVTSEAIERQLDPVYQRLDLPAGRLELMTGIRERRFFPRGTQPGEISGRTARAALEASGLSAHHFGLLVHGSVCRDQLEPATASSVHHAVGLPGTAMILDVSNACLGLLNGMLLLANMIELGQVSAGLVVGTEIGRGLVEGTIDSLLADESLTRQSIKPAFASLTIGSGSAAVVLCDSRLSQTGHRLLGGACRSETGARELCEGNVASDLHGDDRPRMETDSEALMHAGIDLAALTWEDTREALGWNHPECTVPDEVRELFLEPGTAGAEKHSAWNELFADYREKNPEKAADWDRMQAGELPAELRESLPVFESSEGSIATRAASGKVINAIADVIPELIGGSADLAPSNNTMVKDQDSIQGDRMAARNMHFGIREHAMGAMMNGMALHGGIRPYGGTFLVFSDYMRPSVRLAALMKQPVIYIWTHDSIFLGEDGPTHQPVEHLAALRAIPNLRVFRPADANETAMAWALSLEHGSGPSAILLSRQGLPIYDDTRLGQGSERGAYVLDREEGDDGPAVILLASGSEVATAREAAGLLKEQGVAARVVSMPCWEVFEEQDKDYRESVLPRTVTARVAVEAGCPFGWERYTGPDGVVIGMNRFGASAPIKELAENFGFTAENVAAQAKNLLGS